MEVSKAVDFIRSNGRAVLETQRKDGSPQLSPVLVVADDQGRLLISSRETAYKVKNLRRRPHASMCVLNEGFFGDWIQVDGSVEIISLPDAMELLVDYYRRAQGEHEDWDGYRAAMTRDKRVIVLVTIERAGPDRQG